MTNNHGLKKEKGKEGKKWDREEEDRAEEEGGERNGKETSDSWRSKDLLYYSILWKYTLLPAFAK